MAISGSVSGSGPIRTCLGSGNGDTRVRAPETRELLRVLGMARKKPSLGLLGFFLNPWVAFDFAMGVQVEGAGCERTTAGL